MKRTCVSLLCLLLVWSFIAFGLAETAENFLRLPDGVTPDMLCAEYWVPENADAVLSTPEEIAALPESDLYYLTERADMLNAGYFRAVLQELSALNPEVCFLNGAPVTQAYLDALIDNANMDGIDPATPLRYGYSVRRASLRKLPSNDFLGETADDLFYDRLVSSDCMPFMPAIVVHESKDGKWYFVWFYGSGGWIEKENIALCPSRGDWLARQKAEDFLVVTGRELRLNVDRGCEALSALRLPMGTKLPLAAREEAAEQISGRESFYSYVVKLPTRGEDGMIEDVTTLIAMSDDVHVGYLPYTAANVLKQCFKRLGDRYGWAGLDDSNDCSGTVRETYCCFGIELPRASGSQAQSANARVTDISALTVGEKTALLNETLPGSLLHFPGHIMFYLGMKDGVPYVFSSVGSFATEDMEVGTVLSVNTAAVNSLQVRRKNGMTWLESITAIIEPGRK